MKVLISQILRKLASAIELDTTPTDTKKVVPQATGDEVSTSTIKPTARPDLKPPRRNPSYVSSDWDSRQHRTKYMQEYRAEGKDVETGNKYVKKNK